jgi:hypothetical protein
LEYSGRDLKLNTDLHLVPELNVHLDVILGK